MNQEQLDDIMRRKNEARERQVVRSAEEIIDAIIAEQQKREACEKRIDELRAELKALEVTTLDAKAILGGA